MNGSDYMADPARIKAAVERVCEMPVSELRCYQLPNKEVVDYLCRDVSETFSIDKGDVDKLDLLDFLCILYQTPDYFHDYDGNYMMRMAELDVMRDYFLGAEENCIPVKLFLGIPIRAFYEYLESLVCDGRMKKEWKAVKGKLDGMLIRRAKKLKTADDLTLKDVLVFLGEERKRSWYPLNSLRDYKNEILDSYKMSEIILGRSFELAMPERFRIRDVLSKFEHSKQ